MEGNSNGEYKCTECKEIFTSSQALADHMNVHKSDDVPQEEKVSLPPEPTFLPQPVAENPDANLPPLSPQSPTPLLPLPETFDLVLPLEADPVILESVVLTNSIAVTQYPLQEEIGPGYIALQPLPVVNADPGAIRIFGVLLSPGRPVVDVEPVGPGVDGNGSSEDVGGVFLEEVAEVDTELRLSIG